MNQDSTKRLLDELKIAFGARDRLRINRIIADLLALNAPIGNNWRTFAEVLIQHGESDLARRSIAAFVRAYQAAPMAKFFEASVLARIGAAAEAEAILAALPAAIPDPAGNAFTRGTLALNMGKIDQAREHLLRGTTINPASGQMWLALAMTGRLGGSADIAEAILGAGAQFAAAPPLERIQYLYARGKILDELDQPEQAFAAWSEAGNLARPSRPYDADADEQDAARAMQGFDADALAALPRPAGVATDRPIWVTGSPRSGTTLVEQILSSHSAVSGGTELGKFGLIAERIGGSGGDDLAQWLGQGNDISALAADYMHLFSQRFGASGRAVDKTPDASRYLGLAAAILPDARFVWMRRDRLDNAVSCFRTYFLEGADWSFSLDSIARHFRLEDQLLTHWQAALGERLLVVEYEALASNPEPEIRRLLAHCGLAEEPAVFEPHKSERLVTTSSVAQVREPINRRGIGVADRYRDHLQPFTDVYGAL